MCWENSLWAAPKIDSWRCRAPNCCSQACLWTWEKTDNISPNGRKFIRAGVKFRSFLLLSGKYLCCLRECWIISSFSHGPNDNKCYIASCLLFGLAFRKNNTGASILFLHRARWRKWILFSKQAATCGMSPREREKIPAAVKREIE